MTAHERAAAAFLDASAFERPERPTLPPLDVAERDLAVLAKALEELATALGLECGCSLSRSLLPTARNLPSIRQRLAALRLAVSLACVELGIPESELRPDPMRLDHFATLFARARHRFAQVT